MLDFVFLWVVGQEWGVNCGKANVFGRIWDQELAVALRNRYDRAIGVDCRRGCCKG